MYNKSYDKVTEQIVILELGKVRLTGELVLPSSAEGIVVFAHSCGSSSYSTRNHYLAHLLRQATGLGTLLVDLLTKEEEAIDQRTKHYQCDIGFLADRLVAVTDWLFENPTTRHLQIGYFGDSMGSGAALLAATARPMTVKAVVSRGGNIDLASPVLSEVQAATLLIVGGNDWPVIAMNEDATAQIPTQHKRLEIIPGATHQFCEPGAFEEVARIASHWFQKYLTSTPFRVQQLINS
jgi:putative phosphoribosyl transferase